MCEAVKKVLSFIVNLRIIKGMLAVRLSIPFLCALFSAVFIFRLSVGAAAVTFALL